MSGSGTPPIAFGIISTNSTLAEARVLLADITRHHPEAARTLCLADRPVAEPTFAGSAVAVVPAAALAIPNFGAFAFRHEADDFRAALKPFLIRRMLDQGHACVVILDVAAGVFSRLDPLLALLGPSASIVLAPRFLSPFEHTCCAERSDAATSEGIWSGVVVAARAGTETDDLLSWWEAKLLHHRFARGETARAVEQRILASLPGLGDAVRILRDPATDVTGRTAATRLLRRGAEGWRIGPLPLRLFDFGASPMPTDHEDAGEPALVRALFEERSARLLEAASLQFPIPAALYAYGRFRSGVRIPPVLRQIFRETANEATAADPFASFEDALAQPWPEQWDGSTSTIVTTLMGHLLGRDDTLRRRFDTGSQSGVEAYVGWFSRHGDEYVGVAGFTAPVDDRLATRKRHVSGAAAPPARHDDTADVTVIGYLRACVGVGEAGRKVLRSLDRAGVAVQGLETRLNLRSPIADATCEALLRPRADTRFQIFNVNCDQLPLVLADLGPVLRDDAYRILMPFWELSALPDAWVPHLDLVDEIWAPTRFIRAMLMRATTKRVTLMPLPLALPPRADTASRAALGLPEKRFLFFFAFDVLSFPQRKNPLGAVAAFRRAFRTAGHDVGRRVGLVIKVLNAGADPFHDMSFLQDLRQDPDVTVIEAVLGRDETLGLIAACGAVVSLHRSEGLGLLVAEAMALGVPVVATDYSGTTDLLSASTGWPVDARLVPVGPGDYPFGEGQVWADPDLDHAAWQMRQVVLDPAEAGRRAERARLLLAASTVEAAGDRMARRLRTLDGQDA